MIQSVLFIDDESRLTDLLKKRLEKELDIRVASNDDMAMLILENFEPSIIILDWLIPKVDSKAFLNEIRTNERFEFTPVLVIGASENDSVIENAYQAGADEYLSKPLLIEEILNVSKKLVAQQEFSKNLIQGHRLGF